MNAKEFLSLYTKRSSDVSTTPFSDEVGFSIIRLYPSNTPYHLDGKRMFIKIAIYNGDLVYGVDMTKPVEREGATDHLLVSGDEYKKKVTNFLSSLHDKEFAFDEPKKTIKHLKTQREFTINEFVDVLAGNHLSDLLSLKRKLNNLADLILKMLFWFSDKHYDKVKVFTSAYEFKREGKRISDEKLRKIEPFFKYFEISKNILLSVLAVLFAASLLFSYYWSFGDFSVSNPSIVLLFFLVLSICEKVSIWLDAKTRDLIEPKKSMFEERRKSVIERLHEYQLIDKFDLNINLKFNSQ